MKQIEEMSQAELLRVFSEAQRIFAFARLGSPKALVLTVGKTEVKLTYVQKPEGVVIQIKKRRPRTEETKP